MSSHHPALTTPSHLQPGRGSKAHLSLPLPTRPSQFKTTSVPEVPTGVLFGFLVL